MLLWGLVVPLVFGAVMLYGFSRSERAVWNGGVCRENGLPWRLWAQDPLGGRVYRAGNVWCWQSWGHDAIKGDDHGRG